MLTFSALVWGGMEPSAAVAAEPVKNIVLVHGGFVDGGERPGAVGSGGPEWRSQFGCLAWETELVSAHDS